MGGLVWLVQLAINIAAFIFALSLLFRLMQVNYYNQLVQQILSFTEPVIRPLRTLLPVVWRLDLANIVFVSALFALPMALQIGGVTVWLIVWSLIATGLLVTNLLTYAIILMVIMSWVAPSARHPAAELIYQLTSPLLSPFRRFMSGLPLDLSPLFALLGIMLARRLLFEFAAEVGMPAGAVW